MKINSNIMATMTVANLNKANNKAALAMERLSSGLRINSARDDAAGLAIANKLGTQVKGIGQATQNAMDAISFIQTGEGALNEVHAMLSRMKELVVQAANGTYTKEDLDSVQLEVESLISEITTIEKNTEYNNASLLNRTDKIMMQIGPNSNQSLEIDGNDVNMGTMISMIQSISFERYDANGNPLTEDEISQMNENNIKMVKEATANVSILRGRLGAYQNRLEHTVANLGVSEENTTSSLSRVLDADMADEMTNYTQYNVLAQSGIAMLAQANQRPQQVLQLLNS